MSEQTDKQKQHVDPTPAKESEVSATSEAAEPKKPQGEKTTGDGAKKNTQQQKPAKAGGGGNKKTSGKQQQQHAPSKKKEDITLVVSVATDGRTPHNSSILSLAAAMLNASTRQVIDVFSVNMRPQQHCSGQADVVRYYRSHPHLLYFLTRDTKAPEEAFSSFLSWIGKSAGNARLTLVASPIIAVHPFLMHYFFKYHRQQHQQQQAAAAPAATTSAALSEPAVPVPPWGFTAVCGRSYAAAKLGVALKDLSTNQTYRRMADGIADSNGLPEHDVVFHAVQYANVVTFSPQQQQQEFTESRKDVAVQAAASASPEATSTPTPQNSCFASITVVCPLPQMFNTPLVTPWEQQEAAAVKLTAESATTLPPLRLPFVRYPSITDPQFNPRLLNELLASEPTKSDGDQWAVTEKVHGVNFCVVTNGQDTKYGKRTGFLSTSSDNAKAFYNFPQLCHDMRGKFSMAHRLLVERLLEAKGNEEDGCGGEEKKKGLGTRVTMTMFGELCGGEYDNPQCSFDINARRVQPGIQYAPYNFFYGFDVAFSLVVSREEEGNDSADKASSSIFAQKCAVLPSSSSAAKTITRLLPLAESIRLFEECGIAYCKPFFVGSLSACLKLPCEFQSKIPSMLKLPPLSDNCPNFAEGLVIRPFHKDIFIDQQQLMEAMSCEGMVAGTEETMSFDTNCDSEQHSEAEDEAGTETEHKKSKKQKFFRAMIKHKHPMFREIAIGKDIAAMPEHELVFALLNKARAISVSSKYTRDELTATTTSTTALVVGDSSFTSSSWTVFAKYIVADALEDAAKLLRTRGGGGESDEGSSPSSSSPTNAGSKSCYSKQSLRSKYGEAMEQQALLLVKNWQF